MRSDRIVADPDIDFAAPFAQFDTVRRPLSRGGLIGAGAGLAAVGIGGIVATAVVAPRRRPHDVHFSAVLGANGAGLSVSGSF